MGRLINAIFGNKIDVRGVRKDRVVVAGMPTLALRLFKAARSMQARLTERLGTRVLMPSRHDAVSVIAGAMGGYEPVSSCRSQTRGHGRRRWPGHPRRGRGS